MRKTSALSEAKWRIGNARGGDKHNHDRSPPYSALDNTEGMATLEAMGGPRHSQGSKLILEQPVAVPDEHAELVKTDKRFQAALDVAIATGDERIEAVEATVQLKRRSTKLG